MGTIHTRSFLSVLLLSLMALWTAVPVLAGPPTRAELDQRVLDALGVIQTVQRVPEKGIPKKLLSNCRGIVIFPAMYKAGFMVGASYGKGVLVARDPNTGRWSGPIFLTVGGGSFGWQIGVESAELILVITNQHGLDALLKSKVTLGGDVAVAAGPVGRDLSAATDLTLRAEVYSYSRSKGFFAGISLKGAYLAQDYGADQVYYGRAVLPREILYRPITPPASGQKLLRWLQFNAGGGGAR